MNCEYKFETKWFEVPLDHFSYQRNETFKIKYLENEQHWDKGGGPIFFYTGNEVCSHLLCNQRFIAIVIVKIGRRNLVVYVEEGETLW